jgi:hypothetical protein
VHAEAEHAHERDREQRAAHGERRACALAGARRGQYQERQHEPGGDLDRDPRGQCARGGGRARVRAGRQRQRQRERRQQQRVVVRSADRQHEQHRVQADERDRPAGGVPAQGGGAGDQRHRGEARDDGDRLERPQPARQPQRHERVAEQREQRSVRRVLERPADEPERLVGWGFRGDVRVRVESVHDAQPGEREVAEHVLGDQRRPEQQDRIRRDDRAHERRRRQPSRDEQHERVARAHGQHQRLEARAREADAEAVQRPREPSRPAAGAGRHVLGWRRGGARGHKEHARDDAEQRERAERAREPGRHLSARLRAGARTRAAGDPGGGWGGGGLYCAIVAPPRPAGVCPGRYPSPQVRATRGDSLCARAGGSSTAVPARGPQSHAKS